MDQFNCDFTGLGIWAGGAGGSTGLAHTLEGYMVVLDLVLMLEEHVVVLGLVPELEGAGGHLGFGTSAGRAGGGTGFCCAHFAASYSCCTWGLAVVGQVL